MAIARNAQVIHRYSPYLEQLTVKNFKSFKELDITLKRLNVFIGTNASGKSNLVQVFSFLRDIYNQGLDDAISLQGGIEYLRNFKLGPEHNLVMELKISLPREMRVRGPLRISKVPLGYTGATWKFELRLGKRSGFQIIQDTWKVDVVAYKHDDVKRENPESKGYIEITTKRRHIHTSVHLPSIDVPSDFMDDYLFRYELPSKQLILERPHILIHLFPEIVRFFDRIGIYDFDPKLAKQTAPLNSTIELEEDGSNLAIAVKDVISNSKDRRKFLNLVTNILPFVKSVDTKRMTDRSVLFTLAESYSEKHSLPSSLISDGTINITALIIALYFQHDQLTIIEEPERNIHPFLMSKVIEMMSDILATRQIIITTHNPEIVRHVGLEDLFAVWRNSEGYSEIARSSEQEEIKIFLENEMELKELYVQNLLGG